MAVGDDATAAGLQTVPDTGENGLVKYGAREINRTRDYVAQNKQLIPVGPPGYRTAAGITSGTADPVAGNGADGDIYFKIVG